MRFLLFILCISHCFFCYFKVLGQVYLPLQNTSAALDDVEDLIEKIGKEVKYHLEGEKAELLFADRARNDPFAYIFYQYKYEVGKANAEIRAINEYIENNYDDSDEAPEINSLEELFQWTHTLQCDKEIVYDLMYTYFNFHELLKYIEELIHIVSAILIREIVSFKSRISAMKEAILQNIENDSLAFLKEYLRFKLDAEDEFEIYPMFALPKRVKAFFSKDSKTVLIFFGISVLELREYTDEARKNGRRTEELVKILSDNTKLTILKKLREKSCYGSQLAEMLNLTGATISYHMLNLSNMGLVTTIRKGNRVYYELNERETEILLKSLSRVF